LAGLLAAAQGVASVWLVRRVAATAHEVSKKEHSMIRDFYNAEQSFEVNSNKYFYFNLEKIAGKEKLEEMPFSIRILLESVARQCDEEKITQNDVNNLLNWSPQSKSRSTIPFKPARVIMQDFTGVPVMNDLAGMRAALARQNGKPEDVNPIIPVDVVIDHSVQVDYYGSPEAFQKNANLEFVRNRERYEFLHWSQKAFKNVKVLPPSLGIVHQVNLEYLASVAQRREMDGKIYVIPDSLVGTDSHTTMINGLGVLGWGVGGIEAVAAMLGEPIEIVAPDVIGFKLTGKLPEGTTPTDLTLTIIQMLRKLGVVDKFVEFYGPGISTLSLADRAMISNMSPESGATMIYFPVDQQTLEFLQLTGRSQEQIALVENYFKRQHLFRTDATPDPAFTATISLDLASVEPSLAGPKRPQDRVPLRMLRQNFQEALVKPKTERGYALKESDLNRRAIVQNDGTKTEIGHGAVVIAAITSCTNTSNPYVMISAGLVAKKAREKGLMARPYVKTSLAPGSRVVTAYLQRSGLLGPLAELGFNLVGYGCTTCIGNSGPLPDPVVSAITKENIIAVSVLSGNRNFEGRIHPNTQANYLASPPLVVAFALAGTIDIDLTHDAIGTGADGQPVFLRDIWPTSLEVQNAVRSFVQPEMFTTNYSNIFTENDTWNAIKSGSKSLYQWDLDSTYLQEPPFFEYLEHKGSPVKDIENARVLALFGDSITTDHISPAGSIPVNSPAGKYLIEHGVSPNEFNSYGSRRGNDRVLTRGTFANIRIKNLLMGGIEGGLTLHFPDGQQMSIYDAAIQYMREGVPLLVIAGKEYGTGSSRDWAAKGVQQLGVRAVLAESFERIHRSNLAGMGVLPLQFSPGENAAMHQLTGKETFDIRGLEAITMPGSKIEICARRQNGETKKFQAIIRLDTMNEIRYFHNGGLLNFIVISKLTAKS
jgi:aconitate hydratase